MGGEDIDDTLYVGLVCTGESAPNRVVYINAGTSSASGGWSADKELLSVTDAALRAVQVSMGGRHACMVNGVGGVQCWGSNAAGQLGNGTTITSNVPVQVTGLVSGVIEVEASRTDRTNVDTLSSCALLANGTVRCWGDGSRGQLGRGDTTDSTTPVQVETSAGVPLANVTQIAAGINHFCAISAGNLFCWGRNDFGQIGNNTTIDQIRPVQVLTGSVTSVSGGAHTCAVQEGALWCWGLNDGGQLGRGSYTNSSIPLKVVNSNVAQVDANRHNTCLLTSNGGNVMCAGTGYYYANGVGTTADQTSFVFVKIQGSGGTNLAGATAVAVSSTGACALMGDSRLMCWGLNASGELANGNTGPNGQAIYSNVSGVQSLSGGTSGTGTGTTYGNFCAVFGGRYDQPAPYNFTRYSNEGSLGCWGYNAQGQLGNGNTTNQTGPAYLNPTVRTNNTPLTYTVPISNGQYLATLFFYHNASATLSVTVEGSAASVAVVTNTQTVYTRAVTISDGALNVVVAGSPAFISGIQVRQDFAGRALVYAHPLAADGTPETSTGMTWTLPISVPLNYARSSTINASACSGQEVGTRKSANWNAWADSYNDAWHSVVTNRTGCGPVGRRMTAWPQPMLVDIEFGPNGRIALGFADRFGYQMRTAGDRNDNNSATNYITQTHPPGSADTVGTGYYSPDYAGDLLCATGTGTANNAWTLEPSGLCSGGGDTNNSGGATEFFGDRFVDSQNTTHWEPARGALYTVPGAPSVAADASYIKNTFFYFQGPATYSWTNGAWLRSQGAAAQNAGFSGSVSPDWPYSGNQVHDYELLSAPAPVEIGDRVWRDLNANGLQDPGEPGLAGVVVRLTDSQGNTTQATTDAAGYFLFSSDADPTPTNVRKNSSTSRIYSLDGSSSTEINLLPAVSSPFTLSVAITQTSLSVGGIQMYPTVENINTGMGPTSSGSADGDPRDSDGIAEIVNGADASVIRFSVSDAGTNDSSFDFGFAFAALPIGNKIWQDANNNGLLDGSETGIANVAVELYIDADKNNIFTPGTDRLILSTTSDSSGEYQFVSKIAGNLLVVITNTNFTVGGALYNKLPSKSLGFTAVDGNTDRNSVSHGTRYGLLGSGGYVASNVVTISNRREPDTAVDGDDTSGNLTIDFGFIDVTSCTVGNGDVGGSIFIDSNFNGLVEASKDLLPQDVRVFAYNAQNSVVMSATVSADGRYVLPGLYSSRPATETLRFEFTNLPDGFGSGPDASYGVAAGTVITGSGTSIQFRSGASCNVNYGVTNLYSSSCSSSYLAQCVMYGGAYNDGNPLSPGSKAANGDFVVSYQYGAQGVRTGDYLVEASGANVGAIWGMAANKPQGTLLVAATVKRTVQLGPLGLGGIYRMTLRDNDSPERFLNLTQLGIDVGASNIPSNAVRSADHDDPEVVGNWVGRAGIGDIDMDVRGQTLWVTNLYDKKLIAINIAGKTEMSGTNPVTVNDILLQTPIPMPACPQYAPTVGVTTTVASGEGRPWGIAVRKDFSSGKDYVYAGVVCDASISLDRQHLTAAVYRYDVGAASWMTTPLVSFPLNYRTHAQAGDDIYHRYFQPWLPMALNVPTYKQPILADIDFDDDGSMVVQIIDRSAHQRTPYQRNPKPSFFATGGDTLRFCKIGDSYVAQGLVGCGLAKVNQLGLNGGQFYYGVYAAGLHYNTQAGGIAIMEGTREVAVAMMDPFDTADTNGTIYVSSLTGDRTGLGYLTVPKDKTLGTFRKGSGLGDMEVICEPSPLEIGNRIWLDSDKNGIQDTDETPFTNLTVRLYRIGPDRRWNTADDVLVATTTTNSRGEYIFSDRTDGNADRDLYATTDYQVRVDTTQTPLLPYVITQRNAQMGVSVRADESSRNNYADLRDSDAVMVGTEAVIQLTTNIYRDNNHTYDIGFHLAPASIGNYVWFDTNRDGIQGAAETGVPGVVVELRDVNGTVVATTTTDARGYYLFDKLDPADYSLKFSPPAGYLISPQDAGSNNAVDSDVDPATGTTVNTTLAARENDLSWDLGLFLPVAPASLGDRVWFDADKDGLQDTGEPGVNGVVVKLYTSAGQLLATTTTDAAGNYLFPNLVPGDYYVEFTPPSGYGISPKDVGTNDGTDSDVDPTTKRTATTSLVSGENDLSWDLGLTVPTQPASIGNRVWFDTDQDGIQDTGETGVANVKVELYDASGNVVGTLYTDSNGNYNFTNLPPGDYYVRFSPPSGYADQPAKCRRCGWQRPDDRWNERQRRRRCDR